MTPTHHWWMESRQALGECGWCWSTRHWRCTCCPWGDQKSVFSLLLRSIPTTNLVQFLRKEEATKGSSEVPPVLVPSSKNQNASEKKVKPRHVGGSHRCSVESNNSRLCLTQEAAELKTEQSTWMDKETQRHLVSSNNRHYSDQKGSKGKETDQ